VIGGFRAFWLLINIYHIMSRIEEWISGFFWLIFLMLNSLKKKRCFNAQEFTRFLSINITALSHALWRVLSNKVIWVRGHLTPHTYIPLSETLCWLLTSEWDSLKAVCSPPSRSRRVTRIMSIEALVFNYFGWKLHSLEDYGMLKKWVVIIDRKQCSSVNSTW